jgi:molybdenum cofactor cytidylyltransferase
MLKMTGIIILAAGSSSRLGQPKQNVIYRGQTLLQRAIETALASICEPVIVVLGSNAASIVPTIQESPINIVQNADWADGIASSIRSGINELKKNEPSVTSVVLMLCDQPFVDTHHLNLLIMAKSKSGIVACSYDDTTGVPALFDVIYFDELAALKGHEGARKLLLKYADVVTSIPLPLGNIDIDTVEDLERLK